MSDKNEIVISGEFLAPAVTVNDALQAYQAKKDLIEKIMRSGVDFGLIPGANKPCLLKAGAEKATSFFGLSARFSDVVSVEDFTGRDHDGEPFFFYRRACELWRSERLIGRAEGSCNSWEKKYRYRAAERVCPSCGKPAIIKGKQEYGGGWVCFDKKGGCKAKFKDGDQSIEGQQTGQVKNPDIADSANTILKMADKRALIAVVLVSCGLSDYFTQDMEDFVTAEIISEQPAPKAVDPVTGEVIYESQTPAPKKNPAKAGDIITNEAWETFGQLAQKALSMGINLPEYDRSKMTASTLNGASQYINQQITKKEGK